MAKTKTTKSREFLIIFAAFILGIFLTTVVFYAQNQEKRESTINKPLATPEIEVVDYFSPWTKYTSADFGFSFEYPKGYEIGEMKGTIMVGAQNPNQYTQNFTIETSTDSLTNLTKVHEADPISYSEQSSHQEKFGPNTFYISKGKYEDGPCAETFYYRAILPTKKGFIVVDNNGCFAFSERKIFDRLLGSISVN